MNIPVKVIVLLFGVFLPIQVDAQERTRVVSSDGQSVSPGLRHPTPENIPEPHPPGLVLREGGMRTSLRSPTWTRLSLV